MAYLNIEDLAHCTREAALWLFRCTLHEKHERVCRHSLSSRSSAGVPLRGPKDGRADIINELLGLRGQIAAGQQRSMLISSWWDGTL